MKKLLILCCALGALVACSKDEDKGPAVYKLDIQALDGGSVTVEVDGDEVTTNPIWVAAGVEVNVVATADDAENEFYTWVITDGMEELEDLDEEDLLSADVTFEMPAANVTAKAEFGGVRHAVLTTNGVVASPVSTSGYAAGVTITLEPTVNPGYEFVQWIVTNEEAAALVEWDPNDNNKFTMPDVEVEVTAVVMVTPTAPYFLYLDDLSGTLALGTWGETGPVTQQNILLTRFGSLIAFTYTGEEDTWDVGDIKFGAEAGELLFPGLYPGTAAQIIEDGTAPDLANWASWTGYPTYDLNQGGYEITNNWAPIQKQITPADGLHSEESFNFAQGDICRLIGLNNDLLEVLLANGTLDEYDSGYRLQTHAEAGPIYGMDGWNFQFNPLFQQTWRFAPAPGGSWLKPNAAADPELDFTEEAFYPAMGRRYSSNGNSHATYPIGKYGDFWSSTPYPTNNYAYSLEVNRGGTSSGANAESGMTRLQKNNGAGVRCVPNTGEPAATVAPPAK